VVAISDPPHALGVGCNRVVNAVVFRRLQVVSAAAARKGRASIRREKSYSSGSQSKRSG